MGEERWLTVAEIADRLKVHPQTVRRWLRAKQLPGRALGRKAGWRVRERDLETFMRGEQPEGKVAA